MDVSMRRVIPYEDCSVGSKVIKFGLNLFMTVHAEGLDFLDDFIFDIIGLGSAFGDGFRCIVCLGCEGADGGEEVFVGHKSCRQNCSMSHILSVTCG